MGSRIRDNVKHLFQCFCEVVKPQPYGQEAWIIQKFPETYKDEEVLKSVPKFAYPCDFENNVVQHYSFVLTDIDSKWTFGFCRHDPKTETALIILSYLPWHEAFYKLLNHIAQITHRTSGELWKFLNAVYQSKIPDPGGTIQVSCNNGFETFVCQCPNQFQLPSIPENRNLTEYYSAVDGHNMMVIFASMLYERRIIFTSKKLYRLSACVQSANAIIYPMNWQHIFIPVLPMALIDYLLAPMPYLVGVPEQVMQRVRKSDLGEVVLLDADSNTVETPFNDLETLPQDVVSSLRRQLRNRAALLGDGVSRAFLQSLVQLIGGYRDALKFQQGQKITFSQEAFIESRPLSMQPFLRKMLELQIFQQFIEERLEMLNNGLGFSDEFELEACNYSGKSSSKLKQQYKEWTHTMKKEGSAFFKNVKSKANPAVRSAVKTVKERGKDVRLVYKEFRSKMRENQAHDGLRSTRSESHTNWHEKPLSAPSSPTLKRHTLYTPKTTSVASYRKEPHRQTTSDSRASPYSPLSSNSDSSPPDITDKSRSNTPGLQLSPIDMDLMGDLQDVIFKKCSTQSDSDSEELPPAIDRSLKPVRSLESFRYSATYNQDHSLHQKSHASLLPSPTATPCVRRGVLNSFLASNECASSGDNYTTPISPTEPCFEMSANNGFDLFGAMPFVVESGGGVNGEPVFVLASPSSLDLVHLPLPSQALSSPNKKVQDRGADDLIHLDSTPTDDFDPLLTSKNSLVDQSPLKSVSDTLSAFQNKPKQVPEGLSNPLYTYMNPLNVSSKVIGTPNQSFLHQHQSASVNSNIANRSFLHQPQNSVYPSSHFNTANLNIYPSAPMSQPHGLNYSKVETRSSPLKSSSVNMKTTANQDMALLKEYGLDFYNLSLKPNSFNNQGETIKLAQPNTVTSDLLSARKNPLQNLLNLSEVNMTAVTAATTTTIATTTATQSGWTKFD